MTVDPPAPRKEGASPSLGESLNRPTPDGRVYWDPSIFRDDLEQFFFRNWLCVAREEELPNAGDFVTRVVGPEGVLIVRDESSAPRAFYNLCRHRGTRVVSETEGRGARTFACPYHSWVYGLDGRLLGAPHTSEGPGFRREAYGLYPLRLESREGFLWVNFDPDAHRLQESLGPFFDRMGRFGLGSLRRGARLDYRVAANWKILVENYSECYHCAPVHPALNRLTPYTTGENDAFLCSREGETRFAGGYMTFAKDYTSMTTTGSTARPLLPGMDEVQRCRVSYYTLFPNLFFSLHPDYLMVHRTWPIGPAESRVENDFYFPADVVTSQGFDPSDAVAFWDEVNRQDWHVCELAQQGAQSRAWHGGHYSDRESLVADFDRFVADARDRDR